MPEDVPAWNLRNLGSDSGRSVSEEDQATIWEVASKALEDGQRDPERVLQAARRVGRRAHLVENLEAYAKRAPCGASSKVDHPFESGLPQVPIRCIKNWGAK